ncbi:unnamed protein product [Gongylonema pulchrum]|uniref:Uncharacterized protein n=1 Tax=Gongylonema pulchrum TaxID=637853 RepID=A0A183E101_9BILA|nr:unnamed protein product [Gongylonema pulchrum]
MEAFSNYIEALYNRYFEEKTKVVKTSYKLFSSRQQKAEGSETAKTYPSKVLKMQLNLCAPIGAYNISDEMANKVPKNGQDEADRIWKSIHADKIDFKSE